MKKIAAFLLAAWGLAAQAQFVDPNVPGSYSASEPPGSYSATVALSVADAAGTTATQATLSVSGSYGGHSGSGRGGGYTFVRNLNSPASAVLSAVLPDGTLTPAVGADGNTITFAVTQVTKRLGGFNETYNVFLASEAVPVGSYSLVVTGTETCFRAPGTCSESGVFVVGATVTSTPLPVTYWWTNSIDPFLADRGVDRQPYVIQTYPGDSTGPQQVCDLHDYAVLLVIQNFYDSASPGQFLVDNVTSSADNGSGQWVCTYHIFYQDQINNPGVDVEVDSPSGWVTVASGATPPSLPVGDDAVVRRKKD